jgi:hypothetical protein
MTFFDDFEGSIVTFDIPAGAVTPGQTLTITNVGSTDLSIVWFVYEIFTVLRQVPHKVCSTKNKE